MRSARLIIGGILVVLAALLFVGGTPLVTPDISLAQTSLATFVDLPQGAAETYPSSGIYKAPISQAMAAAVDAQTQENWTKYHIAKESNLGLPLGSLYLKTKNGQYVELALYERAAFTVFNGEPARQILSAVLSSGRIQITQSEFVQLPENMKSAFSDLPITGESGGLVTPEVQTMNKLLSADSSKAVDGDWTAADKMLSIDGTLSPLDSKLNIGSLHLGDPDGTTGHRVPSVMQEGLNTLFGEKLLENVGLPLGPAVWVQARISGVLKPVLVQVFERMIVTYNLENDEANRVQVGLAGQTLYQGIVSAMPPPTATPTLVPPTPTATSIVYRIAEQPWFGGFLIDAVAADTGRRLGFTDPQRGPRELLDQLLMVVAYQSGGKYGHTPSEVATYLNANGALIPDMRFPDTTQVVFVTKPRTVGYWSLVRPSPPTAVDLSKPVRIQVSPDLPGTAYRLWIGSGSHDGWTEGLATSEGQLTIGVNFAVPLVEDPHNPNGFDEGEVSLSTLYLLEAAARVMRSEDYPATVPDPYHADIQSVGFLYEIPPKDPTWPPPGYVLNANAFFTPQPRYSLFGFARP